MRSLPVFLVLAMGYTACASESSAHPRNVPAGWSIRLDEAEANPDAVRLEQKATGLLAKTGPNAILWNAEHEAKGAFTLSAHVDHITTKEHPHGAGLFFGGTDLSADTQAYAYILVRSDRHFLIKTRDGSETEIVVPWTQHDAIHGTEKIGESSNYIEVRVGDAEIAFAINGTEVHREKREQLPTDGTYGLRVVHDLVVMFRDLKCQLN